MFDRLIDLFISFLQVFQFWVVIDEYERGVILTLGKRRDWRNPVLQPGFHFVIPFHIDEILVDNIVPAVMELDQQSLTTEDGEPVVLTAVITWHIEDIEKILLKIEDCDSALQDSAAGIIGEAVAASEWEHIHLNGFSKEVEEKICKRAADWGIKVSAVQLKDLSQCDSLRLWSSDGTAVIPE